MQLRELYPYWPDTHDEIVERLEYLTDEQWQARPCHGEIGSIRQIVLRMIRHERLWIGEIIQGSKVEAPTGSELPSPGDLISELEATRAVTTRFLQSIAAANLRDVRTAPADPVTNEIERNVPISWIIWRVMEFELMCWGQIQMRLGK